jgi:hypothetical protein
MLEGMIDENVSREKMTNDYYFTKHLKRVPALRLRVLVRIVVAVRNPPLHDVLPPIYINIYIYY